MALKISDEKIKLYVVIEDMYYSLTELKVKDDCHILIETALNVNQDEEIPVFAYARGIKKRMTFRGTETWAVDYCGLRDAKVHPSEWYKKFGITNYVYYTVRFE